MTHETQASPTKGTAISISRLFEGVPDDFRQVALRAGPSTILKKGQTLFERGEDGGTMYVVQSGRIEISMITESGRKMVFNLIGPGHCIGEIGMLDGHKRSASAIAIEDSSLMPISRSTFFEAVKLCPQLAINMMEILCARIRWVSNSVEEYALHSLQLRLARRVLVLHRNFGGSTGAINITQTDLADFAGATREATNKVLMQWKNDKLISLGRGRITVTDLARLEHVAFAEGEHP